MPKELKKAVRQTAAEQVQRNTANKTRLDKIAQERRSEMLKERALKLAKTVAKATPVGRALGAAHSIITAVNKATKLKKRSRAQQEADYGGIRKK